MAAQRALPVAVALLAATQLAHAESTGRDLLFNDASADLPDVVLSDSVVYVNEGGSFYYNVKLSHRPGMREDRTVDLHNDEVRIYLTSSQEVYQQGTSVAAGSANFKQLLGHRTQLQINTNVFKCIGGAMGKYTDTGCFVAGYNAGSATAWKEETDSVLTKGLCHSYTDATTVTSEATRALCEAAGKVWEPVSQHFDGPLPFVYVPYSTRNPGQKSLTLGAAGSGDYDKVCPLCTHPKYCMQSKPDLQAYTDDGGIIVGSNKDYAGPAFSGSITTGFDGCLKATYVGFAPVRAYCQAATARPAADDGTPGSATVLTIPGTKINFCYKIKKTDFSGFSYKHGSGKFVSLVEPMAMGVGLRPADGATGALSPAMTENEGDDPVLGWFQGHAAGGVQARTSMVGNSDYRIVGSTGVPVRRKVAADDTKCRYCAMPGLKCDAAFDTACVAVEVSGGDTAAGYCELPAIAAFATATVTHTAGAEKINLADAAEAVAKGFRAGDVVVLSDKDSSNLCGSAPDKAGAPDELIILSINAASLLVTDQTVLASDAGKCKISRKAQKSSTYTSKYTCEAAGLQWTAATWRGDTSSGAQLVFDSSNWNIAQTVKVTARADDVYEPEVFGRGQDAYVHHFVVAQDVNLQHTYYDDIDVNALTVSITDDDAAVVLQGSASLTPTEATTYGGTGALGIESAGCSDPRKAEYNECIQSSACYGACATPVASYAQSFKETFATQAPQVLTATTDGSNKYIDVPAPTAALFSVGDMVFVGDAASATCAAKGVYHITAKTTSTRLTLSTAPAAEDTAGDCIVTRACPVNHFSTSATCQASSNLAKCYTDSVGTKMVGADGRAGTVNTIGLCQGTAAASTSGTCEGWNPRTDPSAAAACADTGSKCTSKTTCEGAGHTWTPNKWTWIGDAAASSDFAYVWAANKWSTGADEIKLRLASEPMYDVTVYVQSGLFFEAGQTASLANMLPDDEQLIFQDKGQYETCFTAATGAHTACPAVKAAATVHHCDAHGHFVTGQSYWDQSDPVNSPHRLPTQDHDVPSCALFTATACKEAMASGCAWGGSACTYAPATAGTKAMDLVCTAAADAAAANVPAGCVLPNVAAMGCVLLDSKCVGADLGYDCNSFLTFSSTDWHTWQTLKVIGVADDDDETATLALVSTVYEGSVSPSYGVRQSKIGYLMSSPDWYYTSDGAQYIDQDGPASPIRDGAAMDGILLVAEDALKPSISTDGTGLTAGTYAGLVTTCANGASASSCGSGAVLTIVAAASAVNKVTVTTPGSGYKVGNLLSVSGAQLPGQDAAVVFTLVAGDFVTLGMFDTRFGDPINRYPVVAGSTSSTEAVMLSSKPIKITKIVGHASATEVELEGAVETLFTKGDKVYIEPMPGKTCLAAGVLANGAAAAAGPVYTVTADPAADKITIDGNTLLFTYSSGDHCQLTALRCLSPTAHLGDTWGRTQPSYGCKTIEDFSTTVAKNQVCLETPGQFNSPGTHSSRQVTAFAPEKYSTDGITCGATSHTQDVNVRGVVISRSSCEATEGRRHYYVDAAAGKGVAMARPTGLITRTGLYVANSENVAVSLPASTLVAQLVTKAVTVGTRTVAMADAATAAKFRAGMLVQIEANGDTACAASHGFYKVESTLDANVVMTTVIAGTNVVADKCKMKAIHQSIDIPNDYWTARNLKDPATEVLHGAESKLGTDRTMSMPTCPFTIGLTSAPAEGKMVVVTVHEDKNTADLRDNELYFYEEPTFRDVDMDTVMSWIADEGTACTHTRSNSARSCADACELRFPGSVGLLPTEMLGPTKLTGAEAKPRCFINNVPCVGTAGAGNCAPAQAEVAASAAFVVGFEMTVAANGANFKAGDAVTIETKSDAAGDCAKNTGNYIVVGSTAKSITLNKALEALAANFAYCAIVRPATAFVPNGGKSIDVKFTDDDWNIPRRITVIALNDDVDEPHEDRKVYFTMGWNTAGTWIGAAGSAPSTTDDPVYRDSPRGTPGVSSSTPGTAVRPGVLSDPILPLYSGYQDGTGAASSGHSDAVPLQKTGLGPGQWSPPTTTGNNPYIVASQVTVKVVDDDIADLVVLCGQNAAPGGVTQTASAVSGVLRKPTDGTATTPTRGTSGILNADAAATHASPATRAAGTKGTINTKVVDGALKGFAMAESEAVDFIGSYDDALSAIDDRKIVGLHADATHMSRAGYSAEDGIAYGAEYSFGGGEHDGAGTSACTQGLIGSCGNNKGMFDTLALDTPEISAALGADKAAGAGTITAATSWYDAGYHAGDSITLQAKGDQAAECAAAGTYDIASIDATELIITVKQAVVAYTDDTCAVSRPSGYISGVTLTAADRDIVSPTATVGAKCTTGVPGALAATDARCYPDTSVDWTTYDPYSDKYYAAALTFTANAGASAAGAASAAAASYAAVDAAFVGTPTAPVTVTAGAGSGAFKIGTGPVTAFAVGDRILVTPAAAACVADGLFTVKSVSADSLVVDETVATCNTACAAACRVALADAATSGQVRGFKGLGPAKTEGADEYACTIHTRECTKTAAGFCYIITTNVKDLSKTTKTACEAVADRAWGYWTDSEDKACEKANVGSFQVRLNSSPGQKSVRRQYIGEATTITEKELVHVVITPDTTPQTAFEPASVTFTETGGLVDGKATHKWDAPVTIDVRPVDDQVDERMGVTVDFTAFSITQSHHADEYWTYTTTYQNKPVADETGAVGYCSTTGKTCDLDSTSTKTKCGVALSAVTHAANTLTVSGTIDSSIAINDKFYLKAAPGKTCSAAGAGAALYVKALPGSNVITVSTSSGGPAAGISAEATPSDCLLYAAGKAVCGTANWVEYPATGSAHTWNVAAGSTSFRVEESTPYRHTIRTVHTKDNDFSGVTVESGVATTESCVSKSGTSAHNTKCDVVGQAACEGMVNSGAYVPEGGTAICNYYPGQPYTTSLLMRGATIAGHVHADSHLAITKAKKGSSAHLLITTVTAAQKKFTFSAADAVNVGMPVANAGKSPGFKVGDVVVVSNLGTCKVVAATDATGCCASVGTYTVATVDESGAGFITVKETVLAEANAAVQCKIEKPAVRAGEPGAGVKIAVTEGGSYSYYTLKLDTQPAKIQRQAGTNPNKDFTFTVGAACDQAGYKCDVDGAVAGGAVNTWNGAAKGDHYFDHTKRMRPASMGTVEPPEDYWVDVTATQTIHVDLATPGSCPTTAVWGGGSTVPTALHPRYPFNGKIGVGGTVEPYDEVNKNHVVMDKYLTTCGGWQRDATYRFTASNWNVPQFVYLYAHNDADGLRGAGHVGKKVDAIAATVLTAVVASSGSASGTFAMSSGNYNSLFTSVAIGDTLLVTGGSCDTAGRYTVTKVEAAAYRFTVKETVVASTGANCKIARPAYPGNNKGAGGSEETDGLASYYKTTVRHYVETEDTMDNMERYNTGKGHGFVQRSKHGAIYTWGNLERFPFGRPVNTDSVRSYQNLHETGFTTYGYTSYESIYGYVAPTARATITPTTSQPAKVCVGTTRMGQNYHAAAKKLLASKATKAGRILTLTFAANGVPDVFAGDIISIGTETGACALTGLRFTVDRTTATTIVCKEQLTDAQMAIITADSNLAATCKVERVVAVYKTTSGFAVGADATIAASAAPCVDPDTAYPLPYADPDAAQQAGARPAGGDLCIPYEGSAPCVPHFAEDVNLAAEGVQTVTATGAGTALYQPPKDVEVLVTDNDAIVEQTTASVPGCRSTQLFQYAESVGDSVGQQTTKVAGNGVFKKQWLTDYNCKSGDAGGLPGYPVEVASDGIDGYCTDNTKTAKSACEASKYCTVQGHCVLSGTKFNARVQGECGICTGLVAGEGTGAARYTQAECVKDVNGDGTADGAWSTSGYAWTAVTSNAANCESTLVGFSATGTVAAAGVKKSHVWTPRPLGDAAISLAASKAGNYQCCACTAAYGSIISESTVSAFTTQATCTKSGSKDREGAVWKCSGVGPSCVTALGFQG